MNDDIIVAWQPTRYTGNDRYSGDRYSGNDGYSGLKPPDGAILFTVCGITAIADKKLEILIKKDRCGTKQESSRKQNKERFQKTSQVFWFWRLEIGEIGRF